MNVSCTSEQHPSASWSGSMAEALAQLERTQSALMAGLGSISRAFDLTYGAYVSHTSHRPVRIHTVLATHAERAICGFHWMSATSHGVLCAKKRGGVYKCSSRNTKRPMFEPNTTSWCADMSTRFIRSSSPSSSSSDFVRSRTWAQTHTPHWLMHINNR